MSDPKAWIEIVRECTFLPESKLKQLCDIVSKIAEHVECQSTLAAVVSSLSQLTVVPCSI